MTFFEFTLLPEDQQYQLIFREGHFFASRKLGTNEFVVYKCYGFFVEIEYDSGQNKIVNKVVYRNAHK